MSSAQRDLVCSPTHSVVAADYSTNNTQ